VSLVLVTGGTGVLGRAVAAGLTTAGHDVRIMSRTGTVRGDLRTGDGLDAAVASATAVVHCASDPRDSRRVDVDGTRRLVDAARRAGHPHMIYISIVGVDRIPYPYYRAKAEAEREIALSGLPWTTLRATQFHEFTADLLGQLTRLPVVPAPRGWRFQPVDVREVAARLVTAVDTGAGGRLPDLGGPEVLTVAELARAYLSAAGRRRPIVPLPVPGRFSAALRAGANLSPGDRAGQTFAAFLAERAGHGAGTRSGS
jgi:uncharacterized protein YbjT (DUF2867 family)